ncbi:MAG TPA: 3'-5' exonuclease [Trueperaceae bacterium]|nr:3'-5' exonuclease [Trueperaceae bacterium]
MQGEDGHNQSDEGRLTVYEERGLAPRDLRTRAELTANSLTRLGEVQAFLQRNGELEPLFSTSEARLLRDALWPRGSHPQRQGAADDAHGDARPVRPERRGSHIPVKDRPDRDSGRGSASRQQDPQRWLDELFREGFVVLDTETTGLTTRDEVIEIGVLDSSGEVLLESKVYPRSGHVPAAATRIHGYTLADLRGAPTWPDVSAELEGLLGGRRVFAWNAPFDERMLAQTSRQWRLRSELTGFECAMRAYSAVRSVSGSLRLQRAALIEGVLVGEQSHTSLDDARLTLAVMRRLRSAAASRA